MKRYDELKMILNAVKVFCNKESITLSEKESLTDLLKISKNIINCGTLGVSNDKEIDEETDTIEVEAKAEKDND